MVCWDEVVCCWPVPSGVVLQKGQEDVEPLDFFRLEVSSENDGVVRYCVKLKIVVTN